MQQEVFTPLAMAHINGGYLQASTIEEMFTNVLTSAGKSTYCPHTEAIS